MFGLFENENNIFYRGIVVDNKDPEKKGRVRVRIKGIHSDDVKSSPIEALPWAEVSMPVVFGGVSGLGISSVPVCGTQVWLFLENNDENFPVVFAVSPAVRSQEDKKDGFADPSGKYPLQDRLNEPDFNRIARNEKSSDTPIEKAEKRESLTFNEYSKTCSGRSTVSGVKYPNCHVIETAAHHTIILDDSEDNETIKIFHPKGSFIQINSEGEVTVFASKDIDIVSHGGSVNEFANANHNVSASGNGTYSSNDYNFSSSSSTHTVSGAFVLKGNPISLN